MEVKNAKKISASILEKIKMLKEDKNPVINECKELKNSQNLLTNINKTNDGHSQDLKQTDRAVTSVKNLVNIWSKFTEIATTSKKINFILEQIENKMNNNENGESIEIKNDFKNLESHSNEPKSSKDLGLNLKISEMKKLFERNNDKKNEMKNFKMELCNENNIKKLQPISTQNISPNKLSSSDPENLLTKDIIPEAPPILINNLETMNNESIKSEINVNDSKMNILKNINIIVDKLESENTFIQLPENYENMDGNQLVDSIKEIVEEINLDQKNNNQSILCNELLENLIIFQKDQKTQIDDFKEFIFPKLDFIVPKLFETTAINLFKYVNTIQQTDKIILIDKEVESVYLLCDVEGTPLNELGKKLQNTNITDLLCYFKLLCKNPILAKYQIMSIFEGFQRKFLKDDIKYLTDEESLILSEKFKKDYLSFPILSLKGSLSFFIDNTFISFEKNLIAKSECLNLDENEIIGEDIPSVEDLEHLEDIIDKFSTLKKFVVGNRKKKAITDILVKPEDLNKFTMVKATENEKSPFESQYEIYKNYFSKEPEIYLSLNADYLNESRSKLITMVSTKYGLFDQNNNDEAMRLKGDPSTSINDKNLTPIPNCTKSSSGSLPNNIYSDYKNSQLSGSQTIMSGSFNNLQTISKTGYLSDHPEEFWCINTYKNIEYVNALVKKATEKYKADKNIEKMKLKTDKKKNSKIDKKITKLVLRTNENISNNLLGQSFCILKPFSSDLANKLKKQSIGNFYIFYDLFNQDYTLSYLNNNKKVKNLKIIRNQNDHFKLESIMEFFPDLNSLLNILINEGIKEI